jgi:hypothetical protein
VRLNEHIAHPRGALVFQHACKLGADGIVSKRLGSRYRYRPWRDSRGDVLAAGPTIGLQWQCEALKWRRRRIELPLKALARLRLPRNVTGKRSHRRDKIVFRSGPLCSPHATACKDGRSSAARGRHTENSYTGAGAERGATLYRDGATQPGCNEGTRHDRTSSTAKAA